MANVIARAASYATQTATKWFKSHDKAEEVKRADQLWGWDGVSVSMLLGNGKKPVRQRQVIYEEYHYMMGDAVISSALRLIVTQALGGHETSGDTVFIEEQPDIQQAQKLVVKELQRSLVPIFNRIAFTMAFNGCGFGDAYGRVYSKEKVGVQDVYIDEMVYPPMVQSYEQGNATVGYVVTVGEKYTERLTIKQMARLKMNRMLYVPQSKVMDKAMKVNLETDDIEDLPIMPALVGGSFLEAAEESFYNLSAALCGLVGQRNLNSIDESMLTTNMEGMTVEQRKAHTDALIKILTASKERAAKAVKEGKPVTERFYHIIPTFNEKQMTRVEGFNGSQTTGNISVEDVMLHAKMLAGALGVDLSMLGFSELLSGGLGDGGFFRVSAQAAERARTIRAGLTDFFDDIVDIHTLQKYGWVFEDGNRPYRVNFYGSISALETEQQRTRENKMNTGVALVTLLTQMKDAGLNEDASKDLLTQIAGLDEDQAALYAKSMKEAKAAQDKKDAMQGGYGGGGGFGGQPGEGADKAMPQEQE